jgi:hypothetical protein
VKLEVSLNLVAADCENIECEVPVFRNVVKALDQPVRRA